MNSRVYYRNKRNYYRGRIGTYVEFLRKARRYRNPLLQVFDIIHHKVRINTSPIDYYRFEFYRPGRSWDEKSLYVGKRGSSYYPYQGNSVEYMSLIENKYIFKNLIRGFGLPQPELLFSIGRSYEITSLDGFAAAIDRVRSGIVLKPVDGACGEGIFILDYSSGSLRHSGAPVSPARMWDLISRGRRPYIAEEKVVQHPMYRELHPQSLNTYRVITMKLDDGEMHLAHVSLKVGSSGRAVDNLAQGGIMIGLDREGTILQAFDWTDNRRISHHPDTGEPLTGRKMPHFEGVVATALEASRKLGFLGTIGWDIGVSENGPVIIEGNTYYDAAYIQIDGFGPLITPEIRSRLKKRHFGQRWDRTRLHPRVNRYRIKA